jgi:hypothetical protein
MGVIRSPRAVNLICGLISSDPDLMARAIRFLVQSYGPTDGVSELWPFDDTDYYQAEMGPDLHRQFVSFEKLIDAGGIAAIKAHTNDLEARICHDCGLTPNERPVNLDPGYLELSKLVLATTKNGSHRIYLRDGIYAESTLHYRDGRWTAWPWSYPDYASDRYHPFFEQVRQRYKAKLEAPGGPGMGEGGRL